MTSKMERLTEDCAKQIAINKENIAQIAALQKELKKSKGQYAIESYRLRIKSTAARDMEKVVEENKANLLECQGKIARLEKDLRICFEERSVATFKLRIKDKVLGDMEKKALDDQAKFRETTLLVNNQQTQIAQLKAELIEANDKIAVTSSTMQMKSEGAFGIEPTIDKYGGQQKTAVIVYTW